jgi:hypothetical protein
MAELEQRIETATAALAREGLNEAGVHFGDKAQPRGRPSFRDAPKGQARNP